MAAFERYEHCMIEWYWSAPAGADAKTFQPSFTLFFANNKKESRLGGSAELTTLLNQLGGDGWSISSSVTSSNWILWTLQRKAH